MAKTILRWQKFIIIKYYINRYNSRHLVPHNVHLDMVLQLDSLELPLALISPRHPKEDR